jgi:hypothetical protein
MLGIGNGWVLAMLAARAAARGSGPGFAALANPCAFRRMPGHRDGEPVPEVFDQERLRRGSNRELLKEKMFSGSNSLSHLHSGPPRCSSGTRRP